MPSPMSSCHHHRRGPGQLTDLSTRLRPSASAISTQGDAPEISVELLAQQPPGPVLTCGDNLRGLRVMPPKINRVHQVADTAPMHAATRSAARAGAYDRQQTLPEQTASGMTSSAARLSRHRSRPCPSDRLTSQRRRLAVMPLHQRHTAASAARDISHNLPPEAYSVLLPSTH